MFRFERQTFFRGWPFLLAPEEGLSFKPKCWANLFKYIFFGLFLFLLLHRLDVRISLPFYTFRR